MDLFWEISMHFLGFFRGILERPDGRFSDVLRDRHRKAFGKIPELFWNLIGSISEQFRNLFVSILRPLLVIIIAFCFEIH